MDEDPYTEVARRFFNEFLEFKINIERGELVTTKTHNKDISQWKRANEELKLASQRLAKQVAELEADLETALLRQADLQLKLNEMILNGEVSNRIGQTAREYPLTQHMSERAFQEWERLLKEIPTRRGDA